MDGGWAYLAHSANPAGTVDLLREHLGKVADRASLYAGTFGAAGEARLAGLMHDIGKYGDRFQRRLLGEESGIDHWSAGAWVALAEFQTKGIASAVAIQGHHIGLQSASKSALSGLDPSTLKSSHPLGLTLSDPDNSNLIQRLLDDGITLPVKDEVDDSLYVHSDSEFAAAMLDIRMLFSALVDADFIETEAHFNAIRPDSRKYREKGPLLQPEEALRELLAYVDQKQQTSEASREILEVRSDLLKACLDSADALPGLYNLTAPTGAGKTLSMMAFALKHAVENNLARIIVVVPYLSIIEQTVQVYREAFAHRPKQTDRDSFILENHSMAGIHSGDDVSRAADSSDARGQERLLAENWDAPIIVTTSVQFLESLFANRPGACRKLHRLANSVILCDEVQTIPATLAIPTLATLSHLSRRYHSSVVFSTATQPAFTALDEQLKEYCSAGWSPREIAQPSLALFPRSRRTRVVWPEGLKQKTSWDELAKELVTRDEGQVLCIVNLKKHALELFGRLQAIAADGLFHISTSMCPAHRRNTLAEVHSRLNGKERCILISTQCIEAGVDIDFPVVYRAWGPLEAIAQAAGRCNRNGNTALGEVRVFIPETGGGWLYPDGTYGQAASIARSVLMSKEGDTLSDIGDTALFEDYYREFYMITEAHQQNQPLLDAIKMRDFVSVANLYRVIERGTINVLVPYDQARFAELESRVREEGLRARWIADARPYSIGVFRPRRDDPMSTYIDPVPVRGQEKSENWFIYLQQEHYRAETGLVPPKSMECLIG
jgi:CRISPR-associated endonuclease/helicase Cas3